MKKRIKALFLALCVFAGSITAHAETGYEHTSLNVVNYVNPLYADVITESDLKQAEGGYAVYAKNTYETDEAVLKAELKQAMIEHCENLTICYETNKELSSSFLANWIEEICEHTGEGAEGDYIRWHYAGYSYTGNYTKFSDGRIQYDLNIAITYYTTAEQEAEMNEAVEDLIQELGLETAASDYEKAKLVYDYVCANVTYDNANLNDEDYLLKYSAYAALIHKTAVCQGYALLVYRLLNDVDVDTRLVAGYDHNGTDHGWNLIGIDELYYYADSTWDAGGSEHSYFLKGEEDFVKHTATSDFIDSYNIAKTEYKLPEVETVLPFTDVAEDQWYYDYVVWAYENEVTDGIKQEDGTYKFEPESSCTRAQFVRFLWNLIGTPVSEEAENPFTDIEEGKWYYEAVMWAVENGITNGVKQADGTYKFNPDATCTRAEAAKFLYNIAGEVVGNVENPFTDIEEGKWYYDAIMWGSSEGIINGMKQADGTYKYFPEDNVTRAQVVKLISCTFEE